MIPSVVGNNLNLLFNIDIAYFKLSINDKVLVSPKIFSVCGRWTFIIYKNLLVVLFFTLTIKNGLLFENPHSCLSIISYVKSFLHEEKSKDYILVFLLI